MDKPGFNKNACLANDTEFLEENTFIEPSAYFVKVKWLEQEE